MKKIVTCILMVCFLASIGCGYIETCQIRKEIANDPYVPDGIKQSIREKIIRVGMTKR